MTIKKCTKCKIEKPIEEFYLTARDGYMAKCKRCHSDYGKKNRKSINARNKERYKNDPEYKQRIIDNNIKYLSKEENVIKQTAQRKKYKENLSPEQIERRRQLDREAYKNRSEEKKISLKEYHKKNKDKLKKYRETQKARIFSLPEEESEKLKNRKRLSDLRYKKRKLKEDAIFKLRENISCCFRTNMANREIKKDGSCFLYTGVKFEDYISHLKKDPLWVDYENKTQDLHVDHIIPCASYDWTNPEEIKKCWHPRNLRLLPAFENIIKSNKLDLSLIKKYDLYDLLPAGVKI